MAGLGTLNGGLGKWRIWGFSGENDDFLMEFGEFREKKLKFSKKRQKTLRNVENSPPFT